MADEEKGVNKVAEFLRARNVPDEIIRNFEKEKMDVEAISMASEKLLRELGLDAKGDILAVQSLTNRPQPAANTEYEERKRKLIEELQKGRNKEKKQKVFEPASTKIKTRKISLGWMHRAAQPNKYVTVRNSNGGGSRRVEMPINASKTDIIEDAKKLFFPEGISTYGTVDEMQFELANFKGDLIACPMDDGAKFTLLNYIEKHKLSHVRLYLASTKSCAEEKDDDDGDDDEKTFMKPTINKRRYRDRGKEWRMSLLNNRASTSTSTADITVDSDDDSTLPGRLPSKVATYTCTIVRAEVKDEDDSDDDEETLMKPMINIRKHRNLNNGASTSTSTSDITVDSEDDDTPSHFTSKASTSSFTNTDDLCTQLIGSSTARAALMKEQNNAFQRSLEADRTKEAEKKIEQDQMKAKEDLEKKRQTRLSRVPPQPTNCYDGQKISVAVNHISKGKVTRAFTEKDDMRSVYNWVGSLTAEPEHFKLCLLPGVAIDPMASLCCVKGTLLHMEQTEDEIFDTVSNLSQKDFSGPDDHQSSSESIPDILMEGDEENDYASLMRKRKDALDKINGDDTFITLTRDNIVRDLLDAYKANNGITNSHVYVSFVDEASAGSGVSNEAYTLFWDTLLSQAEGDSECTIPNDISLSEEDFVSMGKIITHQFIQFGTFPIRINQTSIQHLLFGKADDSCKIASFLRLFPANERDYLSRALSGHLPFPTDEVVDILEDFKGIRQMPSPSNIRDILLQVATNELINKCYLPLMNMQKGLGAIWQDVSKQEIESLYAVSKPTPERVLDILSCTPSNAKDEQVFRWLQRYIRGLDDNFLAQFLRFCTASDVITEAKISVSFKLFPPSAVQPTAQTCFKMVTIPRNYENFTQMKKNLDIYFKDSANWDLED